MYHGTFSVPWYTHHGYGYVVHYKSWARFLDPVINVSDFKIHITQMSIALINIVFEGCLFTQISGNINNIHTNKC